MRLAALPTGARRDEKGRELRGGGRKSDGLARRGTIWDKNEEGVCVCVCVCVCDAFQLQSLRAGTM